MSSKFSKRAASVILMAALVFVPVFTLASGGFDALPDIPFHLENILDGSSFVALEDALKSNFPMHSFLRQSIYGLRRIGGQKEINGVFIAEDRLIKNVEGPRSSAVKKNVEAITAFAEQARVPTFSVIIPTASAVLRDELPQSVPYNQKTFIDEVYEKMTGKVTTIDVYSALYAKAQDYIYYRTDSSLTSYGGYVVYQPVVSRLRRQEGVSLDRFELENVQHGYYGDLYQKIPDAPVTPDTITLYHYQEYQREFKITHYLNDGQKVYYTPYPRQMLTVGNPKDIFFGGLSPVIKIETSAPNEERLLVFADESILPYLSFLAIHYRDITVVNTAKADDETLYRLDVKAFDQVLCSYYADSFMTTTGPSRIALSYSK